MNLSRRNTWVRFAYFGNPPAVASLCALFWRGCVLVPLLLCLAGGGLAALIVQLVMYGRDTAVGLVAFILAGAILVGAIVAFMFVVGLLTGDEEILPRAIAQSVPYQGFLAVKRRYLCPMIHITDPR